MDKCLPPRTSDFLWASQSLNQGQILISMLIRFIWRRRLPSCQQSSLVWTLLIRHA